MLRHLGYVAIALSIDATTNRTCRLRNATPERLRQLIELNLHGLFQVLRFNQDHAIQLYRISSMLIPFGSHPVNNVPWWDEYAGLLAEIGAFIRENDMRVSMHPGQFTVLSSPAENVVASAIAEIDWHARLLDSLGVDRRAKIVIHLGGAYGDKGAAMERFTRVVAELPEHHRHRLVIENDERSYSAEEALAVSERTDLPVVFDWLHHQANPGGDSESAELIARCFATWQPEDGLPKVHFSSQLSGGKIGAHADFVDPDDFIAFLHHVPERPFDCMLEAKKKDLALFQLRADLQARGLNVLTSQHVPRRTNIG